ncbi:ABC transporter permease [Candidatus Magnetomonas plexicatena]|uniref:ABC transporter permease n=1 Tax=Candidatus Magnetomonas plexicatena TaxID=2552947 RepID=UPI004032F0F5
MLSVSIAIAAITAIVAAVEGAYKSAYELVDKFGPDTALIIGGGEVQKASGYRYKTLTLTDAQAIRDAFMSAWLVLPVAIKPGTTVSYGSKKHQTLVLGSSENYSKSWSWPVEEGSDLTAEDIASGTNVCLTGVKVVGELFGDKSPAGETIMVGRIPCRVIGVLADRTISQMGQDLNDRIIMPISTVMRKLLNESRYVSVIKVRFEDQGNLKYHIAELREFLRHRHNLKEDDDDDFKIITSDEIIAFLVALTGSLVVFLGITGLVSLVVSGFVLANLFLLSVKERTREIGIRRACGATRGDIFSMFLFEAAIVTALGGVMGFLLGIGVSEILNATANFPIHFSWRAFAAAMSLSIVTGVIFGIKPAVNASSLKPIEAIR